jgi:NRAMP (natural resistance-associated macrophage protein)-like metal ion transporter
MTYIKIMKNILQTWRRRLPILLGVFGPATIAAMADNDAAGVATYSLAGAALGYPILFVLFLITFLLALTQEMGMRLTLVTRKGLGDHIREQYGVKASIVIFACLFIANMGTIIADVAAIKVTSQMLSLPAIPFVIGVIIFSFIFVTKGNYKINQNIMLLASVFFVSYIISAFKAKPDWSMATTNLLFPHGIAFSPDYWKQYIIIGLGVLGTTITPWGQFFISSFAFDKKIEESKLKYSQFETYAGALLTNFFSFFMIVATAATLFAHKIPLISGEQAALAIQPFAGKLAGTLFAVGILNAGFMGLITVSLSTAYAFSEFFGFSGSLDTSFNKSRLFYIMFLLQLVAAGVVVMFPFVSFFQIAVASQILNAAMLPIIFYFLIRLTSSKDLLGKHANSTLQHWLAVGSTIVIAGAAIFSIAAVLFHL